MIKNQIFENINNLISPLDGEVGLLYKYYIGSR